MAWREASCATTAEAALAGGRPADDGARHVGDRDDGVVERRRDVGDASEDVLAALGLDDLGLFHVVRIERQAGRNLVGRLDGGGSGLALLAGGFLFACGLLLSLGDFFGNSRQFQSRRPQAWEQRLLL
jgi:hypothetical protein